jgi:pimeloyl-ACP methyl ester carboxylesterase
MIVVAIVPVNRENEYTHTQWFPQRPFGGLDIYADYLAEDLKAWIDENYRTLSERQYTTLAGCSHGGLASFYTAMKHPHKFGNAICMSSSFWAGLDLADGTRASSLSLTNSLLVQKIKSTLLSNVRPRLWIDWGLYREGGFHNAELEDLATIRGREMVDLLLREYKYKVNHEIFVFEDKAGGHDEIAWGRRFRFAFKTLLGTQPMVTASYGPVSAPQIHVKHPQTTQSHSNSSNNNNAAIRRVVSAPINARANSPASTTSNSYLSGSSRSNCSTPISVDSDDEEEERRPIAPSYKTGHIPNHSISIPIVAGRRYSVQS